MHHRRHQPGKNPLGAFIAHEGPGTGQQIVPKQTRIWNGGTGDEPFNLTTATTRLTSPPG